MTLPRVVIDSAILVTPRLLALPVELIPIEGTRICSNDLRGVQALLTRTVTQVDSTLLEDSQIFFVGTASAGTDHIDTRYLAEQGISLASAAGCNAAAVADYVLDAIYHCDRLESVINGATVGLVGYGRVGRHLGARLASLGASVKVYDPFFEANGEDIQVCNLSEVLACSIVSLHAALHSDPLHASFQMIDCTATTHVMPNALFINAGRGGLVTEEALHRMADKGVTLVLDTWPDEPQVPQTLLSKVAVATPHIAGYTGTAKTNATDFLINPCLRALDLESSLEMNNPKETEQVSVEVPADSDIGGLMKVMEAVSRVAQDDSDFRRAWSKSPTPDNFEAQRTNYRLRSQYSDLIISANSTSSELHRLLGAAGFGGVS